MLCSIRRHTDKNRSKNNKCGDVLTLLHSVFKDKFLMRPTFQILQNQQPECLLSKFLPRSKHILERFLEKNFLSELMNSSFVSLSEFGRYSTCAPSGITGPLKDLPNLRSYGVVTSARWSWTFRGFQEHSIESDHQFSFRPDCNSTADVPSLTLRTALSAIPLVSDRCGVDVQ